MQNAIPVCDAADPFPRKPDFTLPAGACDCHAHVFGPSERYPYTPNRSYTPPEAAPGAYLHLHRTLGIERGVLVQPSVYGTDNRLQADTLNYLRQQGLTYKGVAVVAADVTDTELDQLALSGHCGVRMNLLFKGGIEWRDVSRLADRLAERSWHLQFLVDVSEFEQFEERVRSLSVPVIVDHMGHISVTKGVQNPGFQSLLKLMSEGRCWTKLSGAYRLTAMTQTPYQDVIPLARALIEANPEHCVWGSDWPHPHFSIPMPNDADLLNELLLWIDDEKIRNQILVDNPARFYGF